MIYEILIFLFIINSSSQTFVDLGHELSEETPIFPQPEFQPYKFKLTNLHNETTADGYWLSYNKISSFEHIGTHIDAPFHFYEFGWTLEQIPFERLISPAVVIDVAAKAAAEKSYLISIEDVDNWIAENGPIPNNSVIIGRTGWSKKFHNTDDYFGREGNQTEVHFPGFGVETVKYILDFKRTHDIHTVGFGTDTISLDYGPSKTFEAHQAVQKENQYIIENMNNLEVLPLKGATIFVMPMKIRGGTGAPARVFAQLPSQEIPTSVLSVDSLPSKPVNIDVIPKDVIPTDGDSTVPSFSPTTTTTTTSSTTTTTTVTSDVTVGKTVPEISNINDTLV